MSRIAFLLSKDPETASGGDVTMARLLVSVVREQHDVTLVCLSPDVAETTCGPGLVRVPKPPVSVPALALRSAVKRRSLVHVRYDTDAFVEAIDGLETDLVVADHSYMVEPFLRSSLARGGTRLLLNTVNSESIVWSRTRGPLGRLEGHRILRDELRVARAAHAVGTYDEVEAAFYRDRGVPLAQWLQLTLRPGAPLDVESTPPRLVFFGDRRWPPNQEAYETIIRWWPAISKGLDDAELYVVGMPGSTLVKSQDPSIHELGFVEDLDALLATCRALAAPVRTGGGVRVKILDAASRGLPVVATSAAVGSLADIFGIQACDSEDAFVARCRLLLTDAAVAAAEGKRVHAANAAHWHEGRPQATVTKWLNS
ncbi:MAG: glycosyltransferase [Aeromicrobium sp.]